MLQSSQNEPVAGKVSSAKRLAPCVPFDCEAIVFATASFTLGRQRHTLAFCSSLDPLV